jgi:predicted O-methyltransferase YrrM
LFDAYQDRLARESDIREYLPLLYDAASAVQGCRVLELGTRQGNSTLALLAGAEASGGHVWSCDVDPCDQDPGGMGPWAGCPRWTFTHGDDLHPAIRAALPAEVDLLFIDTSHFYAETLEECRAYVPRLTPGGLALFHDTNVYSWTAGQNPGCTGPAPVARALDDYCAETGLEWEDLDGDYGMGVIRVA